MLCGLNSGLMLRSLFTAALFSDLLVDIAVTLPGCSHHKVIYIPLVPLRLYYSSEFSVVVSVLLNEVCADILFPRYFVNPIYIVL